jgi:hypothetical protein
MKKGPRDGALFVLQETATSSPDEGTAQMKHITNPPRSILTTVTPGSSRNEIRSAEVHCAQSRLLLLRIADGAGSRQARDFRDLAGILDYVVSAIEQIATTSATEPTR